jgi:hypothetical protein
VRSDLDREGVPRARRRALDACYHRVVDAIRAIATVVVSASIALAGSSVGAAGESGRGGWPTELSGGEAPQPLASLVRPSSTAAVERRGGARQLEILESLRRVSRDQRRRSAEPVLLRGSVGALEAYGISERRREENARLALDLDRRSLGVGADRRSRGTLEIEQDLESALDGLELERRLGDLRRQLGMSERPEAP